MLNKFLPKLNRSISQRIQTPLTETIPSSIDPKTFYNLLNKNGFEMFCGVPDSLLRNLLGYITDHHAPKHNHIIAANEGSAIAIASGYHLATNKFPLVYMQNSGIGNAINPILSLTHKKVYSIPMLLLIGWRGEPGTRDEPQHMVQGKRISALLADLNIPFEVLPDYAEGAEEGLQSALHHMKTRKSPYAFLVRRDTFSKYSLKSQVQCLYTMMREDAIKLLIERIGEFDPIVSTTGFASRELFEMRDQLKHDHSGDFLCIGSMGYASSIALGIAISRPSKKVWILDGDGAALMHLGAMSTIGLTSPENIVHVLINNGVHDSVGAQPTGAFSIDFVRIAGSMGYKSSILAETKEELVANINLINDKINGPCFLEIRCNAGAREKLGRPNQTPIENKSDFMEFLKD